MTARPRPLVEVADGVHVATSAVYGTTTTVLVDGDRCLVVDPAVTAHDLADLADALAARGWRPVAVWSTHPHWDHLLDAPALADVVRWGAAAPREDGWRTRAVDQRDADPVLAAHLAAHPDDAPAPVTSVPPRPFPGAGADPDGDGWERLDWDGPHVRVLRHDAHSVDHTALLLVDAGVLVGGDLLSDVEVPVLDVATPAGVAGYRDVLDRVLAGLRRYGVDVVVPGHGTVGGGAGAVRRRVEADLRYLDGLRSGSGSASDDARLGPGAAPWLRAADAGQRRLLRA